MRTMEYLFSYGTLQKTEVQQKLFGRPLKSAKDVLTGYKLADVNITDAVFLAKGENVLQRTVVPSGNADDKVEGMVLEVTNEELLEADKYEPENYERKEVTLESGRKAWIYALKK